jgi:hypothetical protein
MSRTNKTYAHVRWSAIDVKDRKPNWSLQKCEEWLSENEGQIQDDMTERGWDSIDTLLDEEDENEDEGDDE